MGIPDDFREFLDRQTAAEEAILHGDARPRMELWSHRDPVTLFGAAGIHRSGWERLSKTFPEVASWFSEVTDFRFDIELAEVNGDMAYTLGYERWIGSSRGNPVGPVTVRVTHIYRREGGEWKIVHRHGDNPPHWEEPAG